MNEELSSDSNRMKKFQNKLKFETIEISKSISLIAKSFNCKTVHIEDLNLSKRLNIEGIKLYSVNPAYSNFIGNLQHSLYRCSKCEYRDSKKWI